MGAGTAIAVITSAPRACSTAGATRRSLTRWWWCRATRISAAGSRLPIPAGAQVIDLGDATILPGFIDAHTHLTDESSDDWNADAVAGLRRTIPEPTLRAAEFARRTLMAGFTTVRDVGVRRLHRRRPAQRDRRAASRSARACSSSVHALGARGGHCDNTGFPYQTLRARAGHRGTASPAGPDQFRDAVRFQIEVRR